jgi:hypothetical protein
MIEPGIYYEMTNEAYHGDHDSYSKSSLVDFSVYPFNLKFQRSQPDVRKVHFDLGTAVHTAILEPHMIDNVLETIPVDVLGKNGAKNTNAYRDWAAAVPASKAIVTNVQRDMVLRIRDNVLENPAHSQARELLTGGKPEVSVFWDEIYDTEPNEDEDGYQTLSSKTYEDPEGKHLLRMKVRPDYIPADRIIVDLKTSAQDIDQASFEKSAYDKHYHWSAGLTLRGMNLATGNPHRVYIFVVVEVNEPHEVGVYRATEEMIALGKMETMETMGRLAWCDMTDTWPGIPNRIQQVGLPPWAYKKLNRG